MIAELRERGRLVDLRVMPHEDAISVEQAVTALRELDPDHEEMRSMLGYLAGYDQRGIYAAVRMTLHTRDFLSKRAGAAANAAVSFNPDDRVSLTAYGQSAIHHNRHYGVTLCQCGRALPHPPIGGAVAPCTGDPEPQCDGDAGHPPHRRSTVRGCTRCRPVGCTCTVDLRTDEIVDREADCPQHGKLEGPRPAPGTWCQCDWLGVGTPLHAVSSMCREARPDARRACGAETPNGLCDLVSTHPVAPYFPGSNGHIADTSNARRAAAAMDPCAGGCSDPARHAEGGHDV